MKNCVIRLAVLALSATGFSASSVISQQTDHKIAPVVIGTVVPTPMCYPRDPTHCGMQ